MNSRQARTRGYDMGVRCAKAVPFNAVPELLSVAALREAMPAQEGFAKLVEREAPPPRAMVLLHAYRMGVAHGIADTVKNRKV